MTSVGENATTTRAAAGMMPTARPRGSSSRREAETVALASVGEGDWASPRETSPVGGKPLADIPALQRLYRLGHREAVLAPTAQEQFPALIANVGFKEEDKSSLESEGRRERPDTLASIHYTLSGCGRLRFQEREMFVRPGQVMLLHAPDDHRHWHRHWNRNWHPYWIDDGERWEFFYLTLRGSEAVRGVREIIAKHGPVITLGRNSSALARAAEVCAAALEGKIESPYQSSALAYTIVMGLLDESIGQRERTVSSAPSVPPFVVKVEQFCRRNLTRPIGVKDMARVAKLSRFHFSRLFEHARGVTPGRYLAKLRLEKAVRLVMSGEYSVNEIATLSGFADANYLCKVFRKEYGVSPGRFKATAAASLR